MQPYASLDGLGCVGREVVRALTLRGVEVDHVTIHRWVLRFTPPLANAARPCRHALGDRWQVDETYVKVAGQWRYVYRAIDQFGQVVDVEVTTDQAPVYPVVLEELLPAASHRTDRVIIAGHALVQNVRRAIRAGG